MAPPIIDYTIKDVAQVAQGHIDGAIKHVEVSRLTAPGENYISLVLRVDFDVEKDGTRRKVSTVAKRVPLGDPMKADFHYRTMKNEIRWYLEIVPLLEGFGKEYGVDVDIFPRCLGARYNLDPSKGDEVDKESVILLENLQPKGYVNVDRYIGFDLVTTRAILKKLALLHVLPIALKTNQPDSYRAFKAYLDESKFGPPPSKDGEPPKPLFGLPPGQKRPEDLLLDAMKKLPESAPYIDKVEALLKIRSGWPHQELHLAEEPFNTAVHGDFWVNNVMVKEGGGKEEGVQAVLVDFQMMRYGSFAHDLMFLLLTSVQNDVLRERFDEIVRVYYDEFNNLLSRFKTNLELPYDTYLDELKQTANLNEVSHALNFSTVVFGVKGTQVDTAVEGHNPFEIASKTLSNMNEYHKAKLVHIAAESVKRGWI